MMNYYDSWKEPDEAVVIGIDEVHLWRAELNPAAERFELLAATLSADEIERASRFRFDKHRRRFVVARGVLRAVLGRYINERPQDIRFALTKHGKPYLPFLVDGRELSFNLSHSCEMAIYGVTIGRRLGVDVERRRAISDMGKIAAHFFSPSEVATFTEVAPLQQEDAFLNCWTRKEAYVKAIGEGLTHPLDQFDVTLAPGELPRLTWVAGDPGAPARWTMHGFVPAPDYVAALAVEGHGLLLQHFRFE